MAKADPPPPLRLDDYLPYRLSIASNAVSALVARAYETRFGLTIPQWRVIAVLGEDGASSPGRVVRRTMTDKVTISRAAKGLVDRGLARRRPDGLDGRSHSLVLTAAGRALYLEIAPLALTYEERLLATFSASERADARALLRRLEAAAAAIAAEDDPSAPETATP